MPQLEALRGWHPLALQHPAEQESRVQTHELVALSHCRPASQAAKLPQPHPPSAKQRFEINGLQ